AKGAKRRAQGLPTASLRATPLVFPGHSAVFFLSFSENSDSSNINPLLQSKSGIRYSIFLIFEYRTAESRTCAMNNACTELVSTSSTTVVEVKQGAGRRAWDFFIL
ncbi:MAG: hypothetical protein RBR47_12060, partial [Bacteroidales bacterium]|nr:hypothetical protein [Bacteroidales bacterium]